MKHSISEWIKATRYWSFPVSTMPVIATFAYLLGNGMIPPGTRPYLCLALSLIAVVILHSAGNILSDYYDYNTGVDNPDCFAVPNLVFKKFEPGEYLSFAIILAVGGALLGILITLLSGWKLLVIGGIGMLLTAGYSFLKYHALGDIDIFIIFSILIILGTDIALTGDIYWQSLVLAIPIGTITVSVLHANNTLDIDSDRKAGMKSFAMILGGKFSALLYQAYMLIPFVAVIISVALSWLSPWALVCLPAAVPATNNFKAASHFAEKGIQTMAGLDQASAKLQLAFSGLLSAGLLISAIL